MIDPYIEHMLGRQAASVTPEDREALIAQAREREVEQRKYRQRLEALQSGEVLPECEHCGSDFVGRSDARYCSTRCRVAAHRAKDKLTAAEKQAKRSAKEKDDVVSFLNAFYEDTKLVALTARRVKPSLRKKMVAWMRDAIEDIEALD